MNKYYTCFLNNNFYFEGVSGCDNKLPEVISTVVVKKGNEDKMYVTEEKKDAYVIAVRRNGKLHDCLSDYVISEDKYSLYGLSCYSAIEISERFYHNQLVEMSKEDIDNYISKLYNIMSRNKNIDSSFIKSKGGK